MLPSPLTRRPGAPTAVIAGVGFVGSVLIAWASYVVGTVPGHHLDRSAATGPYRWPYEIGVVLLLVAWLALGRLVLDRAVPKAHPGAHPGALGRVIVVGAAMAVPLLFAAPVTSQDVWANLGQGNVAAHGLDPYSFGPVAVPGALADSVAREWLATPAPYGPLWVWICRMVVAVTGGHPWAGMFVVRLVCGAGIVVLGVALARLARAMGGRPEVALWLAVAGPFPLLMFLGGLHNDSVMLALLIGGVAVAATQPRLWRALVLAAALVGAAGAVKVIALVALPFLPLFWFRYADPARRDASARAPTFQRWVSTGMVASAVGIATLLALGVVTGLGIGWIHDIGNARVGVRLFSVPQQTGNLLHLLSPGRVADVPADRYSLTRPIGLVFLVLSVVAVTLTALRRAPERTLAMVMLLTVVSSTAPRIWYLSWPLVFVAVIVAVDHRPRPLLVGAAAGASSLALWFPPSVRPQLPEWTLLAFFVPLAALVAVVVGSALRAEEPTPGRVTSPRVPPDGTSPRPRRPLPLSSARTSPTGRSSGPSGRRARRRPPRHRSPGPGAPRTPC
jgi:alpha-1,6-mannosyltransferase